MKIDITMHQKCSDNSVSCQIERRVRFALSRFGTTIQIIKVRITDINGPKGGVDTRCVVSVKMSSAGEFVVKGIGENIFLALNYCLSRVTRSISRSLERRRDIPIRMNRRKMAAEDVSFPLEGEYEEYSTREENTHGRDFLLKSREKKAMK